MYTSFLIAVEDDTDLLSAKLTLVFPAGSTARELCINIGIIDDALLEGDQYFTVVVADAGSHASINDSASVARVTISDDDSKL